MKSEKLFSHVLTPHIMKNSRLFINYLVVAFVLAFFLSCEEDEKLEGRNELSISKTSSKARITNVHFDGTEGDALDLTTAKRWAANFRGTAKNPDEILSHYFGHEIIQQILGKSGCVGMRIYYALDDNGEKKLLLVGVDANGKDLLPNPNAKSAEDDGTVGDYSWPCPDYCPDNGL
jgi:hypothetical protein